MKLTFTFVSAKNIGDVPLDVAARYQGGLDTRRKCLFREVLYKLSEIPCDRVTIPRSCGPTHRHGFSFVSTSDTASLVIRDAKGIDLLPDEIGINFRAEPVFVVDEGKRVVGFFGQSTSGGAKHDELSKRYVAHLHRDALLFELGALMSGYTMLEPLEYQDQAYGSAEALSCESDKLKRPIAVDEDGSANLSDAIDERETIWRRYILRHSKVKESKAQDAQLTNVEVSLDLNDFCRYGRHIDDLTSK